MMLKKFIWAVIDKYGIWNRLTALGMDCFLLKICNSKEIDKDRKYFKNNIDKIKMVYHILADETSKQHYKNAWKFRLSYMKQDRPLPFGSYYLKNQYFDKDIIQLSNEEVFVDGGAYDGDTYEQLCRVTGGQFKKYIAYEPDRDNYKSFLNKTKYDDRVIGKNKGLWDSSGSMCFQGGNSQRSALSKQEVKSFCTKINLLCKFLTNRQETSYARQGFVDMVDVQDLNTDLECQGATFIKMDIEGSELKALKGAEQLILQNHPKLAICIYHSCEDMADIILYLHRLVPEYNIYVRHHSILSGETVMYAVI